MPLTENSPLQPRPKRRTLLKLIAGGFAAMASAAAGVPILAFFFHPWLHWQEDQWVDVGPIDHFAKAKPNRSPPTTPCWSLGPVYPGESPCTSAARKANSPSLP